MGGFLAEEVVVADLPSQAGEGEAGEVEEASCICEECSCRGRRVAKKGSIRLSVHHKCD